MRIPSRAAVFTAFVSGQAAGLVMLAVTMVLATLLVDGYLLMPGIQRQLNGRNLWAQNVPLWVAWVTHLAFGTSLGFFYWHWQPRP